MRRCLCGENELASQNRYNAKTYFNITLRLRKDGGQIERYHAAADAAGETLTAYIVAAIEQRMQREWFQPFNVADVTAEALEDEQPST